uniref:Mediator of RNA polymerase II transcription subunit 27 n=1 Tax=Caenorhabditis tropicalis TaxID=1561998 RepID=A0A1I7TRH7_9PELO
MSAPEFEFAKPTLPAKRNPNQVVPEKSKEPEAVQEERVEKRTNPPQDFMKTLKICNNLLLMNRQFRKANNHYMKLCFDTNDQLDHPNEVAVLRQMGLKLEENLVKMERLANHLPESMPELKMIEMMNIYKEEGPRCSAVYTNTVDSAVDASNWTEGQYQYFFFLSRFLMNPMTFHMKKFSEEVKLPLPPIVSTDNTTSEHAKYLEIYKVLKTKNHSPEFGFHTKMLHETALGSIIEFKIFETINPDTVEAGFVSPYTIKITMFEKFGRIQRVVLMSPDQEWDMVNNYYGTPQIDPFTMPKHEVYQGFTKSANTYLADSFLHYGPWSLSKIYQFIAYFAKYRRLLAMKCKECNRSLLNFMPCTSFDRYQMYAWHERCKLFQK